MPINQDNNFAAVIEAINKVGSDNYLEHKAYPSSWEGIVEALKDLGKIGDAGQGSYPPGWMPITDEDGNIIGGDYNQPPINGQLWFDQRQGRLFVYEDGSWYQTNGADGLTVVGEALPEREVVGGLWYNTTNNSLYLYDGETWSIVGGTTAFDTASLALRNSTKVRFTNDNYYLPEVVTMHTQANANEYIALGLRALDEEIYNTNTAIENLPAERVPRFSSIAPASDLQQGDFWQNTDDNSLHIYDGNGWQETATSQDAINEAIDNIESFKETINGALDQIDFRLSDLADLERKSYNLVTNKDSSVTQQELPAIYLKDEEGFTAGIRINGFDGISIEGTPTSIDVKGTELQSDISAIKSDYLREVDKLELSQDIQSIQAQINNFQFPSLEQFTLLHDRVGLLPTEIDLSSRLSTNGGVLFGNLSMSSKRIVEVGEPQSPTDAARKREVDNLQLHIAQTYFQKKGGSLENVSLVNPSIDTATLDFSGQTSYGVNALKFKSHGGAKYATFGTNGNSWEYDWNFSGNEDWSWTHSQSGKSTSINKDGIATRQLLIGTLGTNDANGRVISAPIDVGQKLSTHGADIQTLKEQVASLGTPTQPVESTDIYYQDSAPTEGVENGNLWFDTTTLRLYVSHAGAWVNPDRISDGECDLTEVETEIAELQTSVNSLQHQLQTSVDSLQHQLNTVNSGLCTYQIYYGDNAPITCHNGDLWFNTTVLKLYVRHSNAWIDFDRVEDKDCCQLDALQEQVTSISNSLTQLSGNDLNLKADLFNAVAHSSSFGDLKTRLMAALSA